MNKSFRSRRNGVLLVAVLAVTTLVGHLATSAIPVRPKDVGLAQAPLEGHSIEFASPGGAPVSFAGKLDRGAVLYGGDGLVKMELILTASEATDPSTQRVPTDFLIVLDRSGSMAGVKIEQARTAVRELISQLSTDDRFALVSYASGAEVAIPLSPATDATRGHWRQTVAAIRPGGGTNMSSGLDQALALTESATHREGGTGHATRMILISDGLANEGDASIEGLSRRSRHAANREAVVSTIGVGEDFNEFLMSAVADAGTGNYYYLRHVEQLAEVFADELSATHETVATSLAVTIEPGAGVRVIDAAGYPLEQVRGKAVFRPGSLFAGQERRIWVTLAVPSHTPGDRPLGTFAATFKHRGVQGAVELGGTPKVACVADQDDYLGSFDKDMWARSVAEEDYNSMQQRVAGYVKAGRRDEALKEIGEFRTHNQRLNQTMKRRQITQKLETLRSLESEVNDAFEGANQTQKQNSLSKQRQASGYDGRRAGSKKSGHGKPAVSRPEGGS